MRKTGRTILIFLLMFGTAAMVVSAEEATPKVLAKAEISIAVNDQRTYEVQQLIGLSAEGDISSEKVEHTFSHINNTSVENLQFISNGEELPYEVEDDGTLSRYFVEIPQGTSEMFEYEITYSYTSSEDVYTTPLFVPAHAAQGQQNVVAITFEAEEGQVIQRNSFPILKKAEDNSVTSYLMNIPSHTNYIYGDERQVWNSFNLISWASILILIGIVAIWIRSEVRIAKGKEVVS